MRYKNTITGRIIDDEEYEDQSRISKVNYKEIDDNGNFILSAAIGAITDNAIIGGLLGGSLLGGILGDVLGDGELF